MHYRRTASLLALLLLFCAQAHAQIRVDMRIPRRLYMVYEPLNVTVAIENLSGQDITLSDADSQKWFSFQVTGEQDRVVPPQDLDYHLPPLSIPAGQTVERKINLATLYSVQEFGLYRVRASVYSPDFKRYFSSPFSQFEITEGKLFWQQKVGVPPGEPGAGSFRILSLLTFRRTDQSMLYVRVEDKEAGLVYLNQALGRVVLSMDPTVALDRGNNMHVLQLIGPKTYLYSVIGLNGEMLHQANYFAVTSRPQFKKRPDGGIDIVGGELDAPAAAGANVSKLSDRPASFPSAK